jgi:endonuclease-3
MLKRPEPFDIELCIKTIEERYRHWQAPVVTFIAQKGSTPFEILVSTLLSLRTKDQVTMQASARLLEAARQPEAILDLPLEKIETLIYPVGFYRTKAKRLKEISRILIDDYGGSVPDTLAELLKLPGIGRKSANLILVEGFKQKAICVDTHVHRISNRIGYVQTKTPEKTEMALRQKLPAKYWIRYNELLVAFGQVLCKPISPLCSRCPIYRMCPQIGVTKHR